jgi:hypothetical protein
MAAFMLAFGTGMGELAEVDWRSSKGESETD